MSRAFVVGRDPGGLWAACMGLGGLPGQHADYGAGASRGGRRYRGRTGFSVMDF